MKKICFILIISALLSACSRDEMDRTIFIPDEHDYNLPAYTEWGYNSFGAEYERNYFLATDDIVPCKIVYQNKKLEFSLYGKFNHSHNMSLSFIFPFDTIRKYEDLLKLHNKKINLASYNCKVIMVEDGDSATLKISNNGELHFRRAQLLTIDDVVNRVILSGTFEFGCLKNGRPSAMTDGRFDVGITDRDFYSFQQ